VTNLVRVYGPPGVGKTTWLSAQAVRAADKYGGAGVVIASLTRTAAKEVAGRKTLVPPQNIGTLHAHAYRSLGRPALMETPEGLKEWNDWVGVGAYRVTGANTLNPEDAPAEMGLVINGEGDELLSELAVKRASGTPEKLWNPSLLRFWGRWCEFKEETGRRDFTDLIVDAWEGGVELPARPMVFMADEAQDFSRIEMRLARMWGERCETFVIVGDPDQNLYQWRGSDPEAFDGAPAAEEMVLSQSYRVPRAVHHEAVDFIQRIEGRRPIAYRPRDADGVLERSQLELGDPVPLVEELGARIEAGEQVMVLASCGYMLNPLIARLREVGLPFHNPYRPAHGGWNPLAASKRLAAFVVPKRENRLWTWEEVWTWTKPLLAKGLLTRGSKGWLEAKATGTGRWGDAHQKVLDGDGLLALLDKFESDEDRGAVMDCDLNWWEAHLAHKDHKIQQFPLRVARLRGLGAITESPHLVIGTIHSVKGGEAERVYLFPDLSRAGYWDGWKTSGWRRHAVVRMMYVGMTRAREELVLGSPSTGMAVNW
jgi:DNA helicase-2/ATP-dependent DNA helicase PcrA